MVLEHDKLGINDKIILLTSIIWRMVKNLPSMAKVNEALEGWLILRKLSQSHMILN